MFKFHVGCPSPRRGHRLPQEERGLRLGEGIRLGEGMFT